MLEILKRVLFSFREIAKHAKIKTIYLFVVHPEIAFVSFGKGLAGFIP
jgi:hypothetical protein